ncbi:MAG: hypothetical protein ACTHN3_03575 [Solirubrobacterales bacterium]
MAKCVAGRERDWEFARIAIAEGLVEVEELLRRIPGLPESAEQGHIRKMLEGLVRKAGDIGSG